MNKQYKLLSIILVLTILLGSLFSTSAFASHAKGDFYYKQLDTDGEKIYERLSNIKPNENEVKISFNKKLTSQNQATKFCVDLATSLYKAFTAFLYDQPEKFWLKKEMQLSISYAYMGPNYNFKLTIKLHNEAPFQQNLNSTVSNFNSKLNSISIKGANRYEKVKSIYEYLCNTVTYADGRAAHSAYGALIDKVAVCEGYAKAFKILCDREGIPSVLVSGMSKTLISQENHMWNYVQMEDGKWYAVDVTWGDQVSKINYDYLLVGENTIINNSNFASRHMPKNNIANFSLNTSGSTKHIEIKLDYPQLSKTKYVPVQDSQPIDLPIDNPDPTGSLDLTKEVQILLSGKNLEIDNENKVISNVAAGVQLSSLIKNYDSLSIIALNNEYKKIYANDIVGTGTEIHLYHNNEYLTYYTIVVKGDVDGNGKISAVDARTALRASASLTNLDKFEFDAADVNDKGKVTASSARTILRVSSKLENF